MPARQEKVSDEKAKDKKIPIDVPEFMRIAIRKEGTMVNAYFAAPNTMEGAKLVASINAKFINTDEKFNVWRKLLQDGFNSAIKGALGLEAAEFVTVRAPEHERSGHG